MLNFLITNFRKKSEIMLKKSSSGIKKVLAILLAVLFVVSLTAVAVSADRGDHGYLAGGYHGYRDSYYDGGESLLNHPYYHSHDYVNCNWAWDPSYTYQYRWTD